MLNDVERIERVIFPIGNNFRLKSVVTSSASTSDKRKLSSAYEKSYESQKYSNYQNLRTIHFQYSSYLVFSYFASDNNTGKFKSEEVFLSFPHLTVFKDFINNIADRLTQGDVYNGHRVNPAYNDMVFYSEELASQKQLAFAPVTTTITDSNNNTKKSAGVAMMINTESNVVEMELNTFLTLVEVITSINLEQISSNTYLMGMIFDSQNGNKSSNNTTSSNTFSRGSGFKASNNGNNIRARRVVNNNTNNNSSNDDESEPATIKSPMKKRTVSASELDNIIDDDDSGSSVSFSSILSGADNIDEGEIAGDPDDAVSFD